MQRVSSFSVGSEDIMYLLDSEKAQCLLRYSSRPSVGIIISPQAFNLEFILIEKLEYIPAVSEKSFDKTENKYIAIEILPRKNTEDGRTDIDLGCVDQLFRVINYAHTAEGKKVVIINKTDFSHQELLDMIKGQILGKEQEEMTTKIDALLFSPELLNAQQLELDLDRENMPAKQKQPTSTEQNFLTEYAQRCGIPSEKLTEFLKTRLPILTSIDQLATTRPGTPEDPIIISRPRRFGMVANCEYLYTGRSDLWAENWTMKPSLTY